jgi:hypothetical protein
MKRFGLLLLSILAISLLLGGSALAQNVGDNSTFFVTYFSNNNVASPHAVARFINDGDTGAGPDPVGDLWAAIYVFDDSEELTECCACTVTADGLTSEDVKTQLTANPLTGRVPSRGVIKVISSSSSDPTAPKPTAGLRAWATHIQGAGATPTSAPYVLTETAFIDSNLGSAEQATLGALCFYDGLLSGLPCTCTPKDHDF